MHGQQATSVIEIAALATLHWRVDSLHSTGSIKALGSDDPVNYSTMSQVYVFKHLISVMTSKEKLTCFTLIINIKWPILINGKSLPAIIPQSYSDSSSHKIKSRSIDNHFSLFNK
jgi:hypothetical protein